MPKRLPQVLTAQEVEKLVAQVKTKSPTGLRNRAMLAAMLGAGLRVSEVVKLQPGAIDFEKGTVRVDNGKGGRDRVVPVDGETLGHLRAWAEKRTAMGLTGRQAFFCRIRRAGIARKKGEPKPVLKRGGAMTTSNVQALVRRLGREAGIDRDFGGGKKRRRGLGPHILRHTYATRMMERGCNTREVQELLGHSNVSTTQVYTHVNPAALRAKVQGQEKRDKVAVLEEQLAAMQAELAELKGVG